MAYRGHLDERIALAWIGAAEAGTSSDAKYRSAADFAHIRPYLPQICCLSLAV